MSICIPAQRVYQTISAQAKIHWNRSPQTKQDTFASRFTQDRSVVETLASLIAATWENSVPITFLPTSLHTNPCAHVQRLHMIRSWNTCQHFIVFRFLPTRPIFSILAMYSVASGTLQDVSPIATSTLPIFLAVAFACFSNGLM